MADRTGTFARDHREGMPLSLPFLSCAALMSTWGAVEFGGVKLTDTLVALATVAVILDTLRGRRWVALPSWLVGASAAITLVIVIHFLSSSNAGARAIFVRDGLEWLTAVLVLPSLAAVAIAGDIRRARYVLRMWILGAAISCAVALLDYYGVTSINVNLSGALRLTDRQAGLAPHPNDLGVASALVLPFAFVSFRARSTRVIIALLLLVGVLLSGSRAAQGGALIGVVMTYALVPLRRRDVALSAAVGAGVAAMIGFDAFRSLFRFGSAGALLSDSERAVNMEAALAAFYHDPLFGSGFGHITGAHNIYLQALAAGGSMLLIGLVLFFVGNLAKSKMIWRTDRSLAVALLISMTVWMLMGYRSNQLVDRYLYFGAAALASVTVMSYRDLRLPQHGDKVAVEP